MHVACHFSSKITTKYSVCVSHLEVEVSKTVALHQESRSKLECPTGLFIGVLVTLAGQAGGWRLEEHP